VKIAAARALIAQLPTDRPITDPERAAILALLESADQIFAAAFLCRLHLQDVNGWPPHKAVAEAVRRFQSRVDDVTALRNAVKNPNGRIRQLAKKMSDSFVGNGGTNEISD